MAHPPLPPPTHLAHQSSFASLELSAVLDDLAARFIVNLPAEELESMDRVCFQIEQAHWYYEDFVRPMASNPSLLPSYTLKAFSLLMFKSCPLLHDLVPQHAQIWASFMQYKERVPVCGAVLINEWWDKVLLVKGWTKGSSWSFPRGKINKEEPEAMCAVREVLEETGFDLSSFFPPAQLHPSYVEPEGQERVPYYVELVIREQKIRLYFIPGVSEQTYFETRTRKEISKIDWFSLSDLPTWSKEVANGAGGSRKGKGAARSKSELANGRQAKFYMVTPFISHLKLWIDRNKPRNLPRRPAKSALSPPPTHVRAPSPEDQPVLFGGRVLRPWTEDDATSHLPSEGEHADGEESTEDDSAVEEDEGIRAVPLQFAQPASSWETMQQGTDALQALFFGAQAPASPSLPPPPPPLRPLPVPTQQHATPVPSSSSTSATATATPPHIAYERQQSFLQPVPKPSNQQSKLLELLAGAPPGSATPPPPPPQHSLVSRLETLSLATPSPLTYMPAAAAASTQPVPQHSAPPPSAFPLSPASVAAAQPFPPQAFDALQEDQKREKHNALLRALLSVATKSPPRAPLPPLEPVLADPPQPGKGSLLSILNGGAPAPSGPGGDAPDAAQVVAKDPLQILREFRARQQQSAGGAGGAEASPEPATSTAATDAPQGPAPLPLPGSSISGEVEHSVSSRLNPEPHYTHPLAPPSTHSGPASVYSSPPAVIPPTYGAQHLLFGQPTSYAPHESPLLGGPGGSGSGGPGPGHGPQPPYPLHVPYPTSSLSLPPTTTGPHLHPHPHPHVLQQPAAMQVLPPYPYPPPPSQQLQQQQHFPSTSGASTYPPGPLPASSIVVGASPAFSPQQPPPNVAARSALASVNGVLPSWPSSHFPNHPPPPPPGPPSSSFYPPPSSHLPTHAGPIPPLPFASLNLSLPGQPARHEPAQGQQIRAAPPQPQQQQHQVSATLEQMQIAGGVGPSPWVKAENLSSQLHQPQLQQPQPQQQQGTLLGLFNTRRG